MAHDSQLPCDGDGICMLCKKKPSDEETLTCKTCVTPWHVSCLSVRPQTLASTLEWECPDCSPATGYNPAPIVGKSIISSGSENSGDLITAIRAIEADQSLTEQEKAKKRQELMSRGVRSPDLDKKKKEKMNEKSDVLDLLDGNLNCSFCMQLPERPVTTPCGHNFCLKCFQKWTGQGKRTCAKCRNTIPPKMASQPRINSAIVVAIRMAKMSKSISTGGPLKVYHFVHNQNRPDKAFTTERAKRAGKSNACSGKIFVTTPPDHFGPILAENDPERKQGLLVGESWEDRMECRQWGAHLPHIAGIAGQSEHGAQSVALSGGYEDDEDHGEWFLYTGSGGRDLSGNKRTNKEQSFDQKFEKLNEALRVSCKKGYPVRVVRSHKEKRSSYAPETGVRYDGIYRIEKCWRKAGIQGFKVCRYLFVRCDNDPAPWTRFVLSFTYWGSLMGTTATAERSTLLLIFCNLNCSDEHGDRPRPLPVIQELKKATDTTERKESPSWDYDEEEGCWKWKKLPPLSRKSVDTGNPEDRKRARRVIRQAQNMSVREKLLKEFSCLICGKVMTLPLTTPCGHNFCKPCLEGAFAGQNFVTQRTCEGRRTLRAQKNIMKCPTCPNDIADFLQNPQVNRELMDVIESLQHKTEETGENVEESSEEEVHGMEEKLDTATGDTEIVTVNSETVKDGHKEMQSPPTESKLQRTYKRKKADSEDCLSLKLDDGEKTKTSAEEKPVAANGDTEVGIVKFEMPEAGNTDFQAPATERMPNVVTGETGVSTKTETIGNGHKDVQNPPTESKPKRTYKRKKADGGEKSKISAEVRPDTVNGDTEVSIVKSGISEGGYKDLQAPPTDRKPKRTYKGNKVDGGNCSSGPDVGVKTRSRKAQELVDEGNDSPSSPLHVQSDGDDFE
ncbi:hypothetical protein HHK36_007668 [Tetracentron sinense]|uniref:RING-type E3 ubiquitin transferase n=1 Tax=Tetracentron sinense TaxID=13715 RepID=A0A835DQC1_TETSI|nr:hypothetical protein HHK36_007668 [Tetracentron sinense]